MGGELLLLAFLPGKLLRQDILGALAAGVFCLLLILPALLFWGAGPVMLLPLKTFLCVTALNLLQQHFSWHELTAALRRFYLPAEVIFILDTTLRYLVLLGDQASLLLTSLKLRSVGHNPKKHKAMAGIMGIVMQRSQRLSLEMAEAMRCRCFTGNTPCCRDVRKAPVFCRIFCQRRCSLSMHSFTFVWRASCDCFRRCLLCV